MKTDVVIFDLFGTLVNFGIQHHPYRQLLKWAREHGRKPLSNDARTIMTINGDIQQVANQLGINSPDGLIRKLTDDIEDELASLTLFDDVLPVFDELQQRGIKLAICSNLAKPYGAIIERLLIQYRFEIFLSYEYGFIKPEPEIYHCITSAMKVAPSQCVFIGDTHLADVWGPQQIGMKGIHLCRTNKPSQNSISRLSEMLDMDLVFY